MKQKDSFDVSIIFVNYKTRDLTINAIKSVIEKTEDLEYEIFVVDNNSQDGSIEAIEKEFPNINIIKNPVNAGFGVANNLAIKQAKGKYVLCLNTDTLLINNAIKIMFDFMEQNPKAGACGGQLYNKDNTLQESFGFYPSFYTFIFRYGLLRKYYINRKLLQNAKKAEFIIGADLMIKKSVLDKVGLFDENIFMYGEEVDLCYRITKENFGIFIVPESKIIHFGGQSSPSEKAFWAVINGHFYFVKKHKNMNTFILKLYYLIKYTLAFVITKNNLYTKSLKLIFNNSLNGSYNNWENKN